MNFDLLKGLVISNFLLAFIILIIWWILLMKNFEFCLSVLVVGSFIAQYTEINLIFWNGTLLLPFALMTLLSIIPKLFNLLSNFDSFTKQIIIVITIYFFLIFVRNFFLFGDPIIILTNLLFDFTRIFLPFYGVLIILKKNGSLLKHIKYNAYLSLIICFCYLIVIFTSSSIFNVNSLRNLAFWNMPLGAFSSLGLWSLFYLLSKLLLEYKNKRRLLLIVLILLPLAVILLSQSRGLLPSIILGIYAIIVLSKNKIKGVLPVFIGVIILFFVANMVSFNISNEDVSVTDIYSERFSSSSNGNIITDDSRFALWQNAIESIFSHPFGGASIKSKIGVHNLYLEMLMQIGVFGLFYTILLFIGMRKVIKFLIKFKLSVSNDSLITTGLALAVLYHAIFGGLLGGTFTFLYWSIALLLCLRIEVIKSDQFQQNMLNWYDWN